MRLGKNMKEESELNNTLLILMDHYTEHIHVSSWNDIERIMSKLTVEVQDLTKADLDEFDINSPIFRTSFIEDQLNIDKEWKERRDFQEELKEDILDGDSKLKDNLIRIVSSAWKSYSHKDIRSFSYFIQEISSYVEDISLELNDDLSDLSDLVSNLKIEKSELIYISPEKKLHVLENGRIILPDKLASVAGALLRKINSHPSYMYKLKPREFEEIVAELFLKNGFDVKLTKATRDGGRDIIAFYEHMDIQMKYIIECKRYAENRLVSIGFVQRLLGVKIAEQANKAILATTSGFTKPARQFAANHIWDLALKDYNDILYWIKATV